MLSNETIVKNDASKITLILVRTHIDVNGGSTVVVILSQYSQYLQLIASVHILDKE
jgi:hypothetical protein